jgi:hypothetical protein
MYANFRKQPPCSIQSFATYRLQVSAGCNLELSAPPFGAKEILQNAILAIWDRCAADALDLHVETFLQHIAKTERELFNLLQLAAGSCSIVSLTENALLACDAAYLATQSRQSINQSDPDGILPLPKQGQLRLYGDLHRTSQAEATVCLCGNNFLPTVSNYRSFRLHADAGPRMRRDCELALAKVQSSPWAIVTLGYFLPFRYVIHCRTPFIDSDVGIVQQIALRDAYVSALELAAAIGIESIEIPMMHVSGSRSTFDKLYRASIEAIFAAQNSGAGFKNVSLIGCSPA